MTMDFAGVVDALPGLVWITHADGRCDFVNRGWRDYTGIGSDEANGHGWQKTIHPDDLKSFAESWKLIKESGAGEIDVRLRRRDGQYRWYVFRPSPLPEDEGPRRWCWLGLDVDERATTDGRFRRLFDMMPVQCGFLDAAMVLENANLKSLQDFNMTLEQLKQWTTSGIIHVDDFERNNEHIKALLGGAPYETDLRFLYPDGSYRWMHCLCVPVRDAQGSVVRYVSVQLDVDDLKQAEALLAVEVKLLEMVARGEPLTQVLESLSRNVEELCRGCFCSVLLVAPDRKHVRVGARSRLPDAWADFFDNTTIDSSHDPCALAVIEKTSIVSSDLAHDPRWEGSPWRTLMYSLGLASCSATPVIAPSGEVSAAIAICRPRAVTPGPQEEGIIDRFAKIAGIAINRDAAEEALNQTRNELAHVTRVATLNAMTASIAHEVSQPLAGILTNANTGARMLAADPPNLAVAAETIRRTIRDANRATDVIQRLRAMFSTKPTTMELGDLNDVAREVIALSTAELRRTGAVLQTEFAEGLPHVKVDRVQLQQVILNLLLNAGDAMSAIEDRPRNVLVRTALRDDGNVVLLVRDSGTGIASDKIGRLFDAFYTTKAKGMGVGLSISRSIIEKHGGRLWAENNDGHGATFSFSLPSAPVRAG